MPAIPANVERLTKTAMKFAGSWIGQTMGYDHSPAHIWEITARGPFLNITTRWENDPRTGAFFGRILDGEDAFVLRVDQKAILVDAQHFYIAGWDSNDIRGHKGPHYDVVFSRPGLAELSAEAVWEKVKKAD